MSEELQITRRSLLGAGAAAAVAYPLRALPQTPQQTPTVAASHSTQQA